LAVIFASIVCTFQAILAVATDPLAFVVSALFVFTVGDADALSLVAALLPALAGATTSPAAIGATFLFITVRYTAFEGKHTARVFAIATAFVHGNLPTAGVVA